ncbi:unnamed protein product [Arctogadus glacialis]
MGLSMSTMTPADFLRTFSQPCEAEKNQSFYPYYRNGRQGHSELKQNAVPDVLTRVCYHLLRNAGNSWTPEWGDSHTEAWNHLTQLLFCRTITWSGQEQLSCLWFNPFRPSVFQLHLQAESVEESEPYNAPIDRPLPLRRSPVQRWYSYVLSE